MRTELLLSRESAARLYPRSYQATQHHPYETFTTYFTKYRGGVALTELGCTLDMAMPDAPFKLEYDHYLVEVPPLLAELEVAPIGIKLTRIKNAPTRARAGFYCSHDHHATATVERVLLLGQGSDQKPPLCVHNITVTAKTLAAAKDFNSLVSTGAASLFLVEAWE